MSFRKATRMLGAALLLLSLVVCSPVEEHDDYGLLSFSLRVSPEELSVLRAGVYLKSPGRGRTTIEGKEFKTTIKFAGASSIDNLKKSLDLEFNIPFRGRTRYRLNAMNGDPSALKALIAYHCYQAMGFDMPTIEPVSLWLNDEYSGLYLLQERYDEDYFASRGSQPVTMYKAQNTIATLSNTTNLDRSFNSKIGHPEMPELVEVVLRSGMAVEEGRLKELEGLVDIEQLISYMAVTAFIHNTDGVANNYHMMQTKEHPRFFIMPWDLDLTFRETVAATNGKIFRRNLMMRRVFEDAVAYQDSYQARFDELYEVLSAEQLSLLVDERQAQIEEAWKADPILAAGDLSLQEHVALLKERFLEQDDLRAAD